MNNPGGDAGVHFCRIHDLTKWAFPDPALFVASAPHPFAAPAASCYPFWRIKLPQITIYPNKINATRKYLSPASKPAP
jgi:hypothetical protein